MVFREIARILGGLFLLLGATLFFPAGYAWFTEESSSLDPFLGSAGITIASGLILLIIGRGQRRDLSHRSAILVVSLTWLGASVISALPYLLTGSLHNPIDALFESVSGLTGTGSSVIADVEVQPRALLLWRSMTQWLGGMGIVVFFMAILPILGVGGVQLFRAEVSGPRSDKIAPRVRDTARRILIIYSIMTITCILALVEFGDMSWFDSVNHTFTGVSTGGFSTKNAGVGAFKNRAVDYILSFFMFIASISFTLHYRFFVQRDRSVLRDTEARWYIAIVFSIVAVMTWVTWGRHYENLEDAFRNTLFVAITTVTCTGYSNADYLQWPPVTHFFIIILMVMGGMSGSTAGGIKCIRLVAAIKQLGKQMKQVVHPRAVIAIRANGQAIPVSTVDAIWGLIFMYFFVLVAATVALTYFGLDLVTAGSAVITALSNVGPGLGDVGPMFNFSGLSDPIKFILTGCMLVGRLEFFTLLAIFTPTFWRG